ncbi:MAG: transglutaminase domain-containing protein [Eubacterium sp.]
MENKVIKRKLGKYFLMVFALMFCLCGQKDIVQARPSVKATTSGKALQVGNRMLVRAETTNVSFSSSNSAIASVDSKGIITGKRGGKVTIYVKREGYETKKIALSIRTNKKKPATLPVSFSEVSLTTKNGAVYVSNTSKNGNIKKIIYSYKQEEEVASTPAPPPAQVVSGSVVWPSPTSTPTPATQKVMKTMTLTAENVGPGKTVAVQCEGDKELSTDVVSKIPEKIEMYTGNALYRYEPGKKVYSFDWGTKDTKAPKFSGLIGKKSCSGNGDYYRIYYSDKKNDYNFKQFVSATDDRDGKVKVQADTSKINWKKKGVYKLYFYATDKAGNKATSWAKVQVLIPGSAESAADQILRSITRTNYSDKRKTIAIYNYVRGQSTYVHNSAHVQWRAAALRGLRYQSGDCYTYYAMSRLLLTRAGIPNVMIRRYPEPRGQRHFWNLCYVQDGWYHFDTTPRSRGGRFCLRTDAQLWAYSSGYTFQFNKKLYPARATRRIS